MHIKTILPQYIERFSFIVTAENWPADTDNYYLFPYDCPTLIL